MKQTPSYPPRRNLRVPEFDYSQPGAYFVTIVTHDRITFFGQIVDGEMVLNEVGKMVERVWIAIPEHFPNVELGEFVIMPNHIHGIISITVEATHASPLPRVSKGPMPGSIEAQHAAPAQDGLVIETTHALPAQDRSVVEATHASPLPRVSKGPMPGSIGAIIGSFKSAATKRFHEIPHNPETHLWQRNYYERFIRNERDYKAIYEYIISNPMNWDKDEENSTL